jgi:hypothetical protein
MVPGSAIVTVRPAKRFVLGVAANLLSDTAGEVLTTRILAAIDAAIFVAQFAVCQIGRIFVCPESFSVSVKDLRG